MERTRSINRVVAFEIAGAITSAGAGQNRALMRQDDFSRVKKAIGAKIRKIREVRMIASAGFAEEAGMTPKELEEFEGGRMPTDSTAVFRNVLYALGLSENEVPHLASVYRNAMRDIDIRDVPDSRLLTTIVGGIKNYTTVQDRDGLVSDVFIERTRRLELDKARRNAWTVDCA